MKFKAYIIVLAVLFGVRHAAAQQKNKLYFTTGFGLISPEGKFGNAVKSTLAFNSGIEMALRKNWFTQAVFDFNALKYDQQIRDAGSPYLFQHTNSSLLLLGINGGKNLFFSNPLWFISFYGGSGYLNIGEPRITTNPVTLVARQEVTRARNIFFRGGSRLAYKTRSAFFQTLYFDASYWNSPAVIQGGRVTGISFYIGTRFGTIE